MAASLDSTFHELSRGGDETSINEGSSLNGWERVAKRSRTAQGLMKEISKSSFGFSSYSVPGKSLDLARSKPRSSLLNDRESRRRCLIHSSVPFPVAGSKPATRSPMK